MDNIAAYKVPQIRSGGGYPGRKIWEQEENMSTHYDYHMDRQCTVPIYDIKKLREELHMGKEN